MFRFACAPDAEQERREVRSVLLTRIAPMGFVGMGVSIVFAVVGFGTSVPIVSSCLLWGGLVGLPLAHDVLNAAVKLDSLLAAPVVTRAAHTLTNRVFCDYVLEGTWVLKYLSPYLSVLLDNRSCQQ